MKRLLGPVLHAESQPDPNLWSFRLNLYLHGGDGHPPPLTLTFYEPGPTGPREAPGVTVTAPRMAADFSRLVDRDYAGVCWSWHVRVQRDAEPRVLMYRIAGADLEPIEVPDVLIPARGALPRAAFFSCNGAPNVAALNGRDPLALWFAMLDEHQRLLREPTPRGFSLLIGGGDQLYADALFNSPFDFPLLYRFARRMSLKERVLYQLKDAWEPERARVLAGYVRLYCLTWGEGSGMSEMLARVPGLFTWDDHDILDGWGSQELLQGCDVYRMMYPEAARCFEAFQLGREGHSGASLPSPLPSGRPIPHYFQALSFVGQGCELQVVALDGRSGRTDTRVLSAEQWQRFDTWRREDVARSLASPHQRRHVLVVSSIPPVYRRLSPRIELMASTTVGIRSLGLRDDLLDLWESRLHRPERARFLKNLLAHSAQARCAVTLLCGDIHVGLHGRIVSSEPEHLVPGRAVTVIEQLVSSGIVHPAVNKLLEMGMDVVSHTAPERSLGPLTQTYLEPMETGGVLLQERNWLDVELERGPRAELRAQWYAEDSRRLPTQVVVTPPPGR